MTQKESNTAVRFGLLLIAAGSYVIGGWKGVGWVALVLGVVYILGAALPAATQRDRDSIDTWHRSKMERLRKQEQDRVQ